MSQIRIEQLSGGRGAQQAQDLEQARRRVQLFATSSVEDVRPTFAGIGRPDLSAITAGSQNGKTDGQGLQQTQEAEQVDTIRLPDGQQLELPRLSAEQRARVEMIFATSPQGQRGVLQQSAVRLGAAAFHEIDINSNAARLQSYSAGLRGAAQDTYEQYTLTHLQATQEDAIRDTALLGLWGMEQNLYGYFNQLREEQQVAGDLRTDLAELNEMLADWPDDGSTELFSYREVVFNDDGSISVIEHQDVALTKAEAEALALKLEGQINSLGQVEQRHMMVLQKMVTDYQKAETVMSNIMRQQHDTHKTLINNAKA